MQTASPALIERPKPLAWWSLGLMLCGVAALPVDLWFSNLMQHGDLPGDIRKALDSAEVMGHGIGVLFVIATVIIAARPRVDQACGLAACAFGAGLLANVWKMVLFRTRPEHFAHGDVLDTFEGLAPWLLSDTSAFTNASHSFPSAHTATAVGLCTGLACLYPRGRYWFPVFGVLVALQRLETGAHYLSDTLWGAAGGLYVSSFLLETSLMARIFRQIRVRNGQELPEDVDGANRNEHGYPRKAA